MPALGMAQETGRLIRWLKTEGEPVTQGEPLLEIETDKATVEVEATGSGTLANVTAHEGEDIPVGQVIALILAPGEAAPPMTPGQAEPSKAAAAPHPVTLALTTSPAVSHRSVAAASPVAARIAAEHGIDLAQVKPDGGRVTKQDVLAYVQARQAPSRSGNGQAVLASPKARRIAREQGIELQALAGSGPDGAVLAADIETAARQHTPSALPVPVSGTAFEVSTVWRIMAERLSQAWTSIPHFYLTREVDASRLIGWRDAALKRSAEKITYTDLLVKLVSAALREHPRTNASWQDGQIIANPDINIGLAVAVEAGLIVPVIHHADTLTLEEIAARRRELVERASAGGTKLEDLQGETFTISNLGMYGVDAFSAIINPPQAAILAVGRIAERVVPINGQPAVRPMMVTTLSCDHRVVDGVRGAQFLDTLAGLIEEPLSLIE